MLRARNQCAVLLLFAHGNRLAASGGIGWVLPGEWAQAGRTVRSLRKPSKNPYGQAQLGNNAVQISSLLYSYPFLPIAAYIMNV